MFQIGLEKQAVTVGIVCCSEMGVIERFDFFLSILYQDFPLLNILEVNGWK